MITLPCGETIDPYTHELFKMAYLYTNRFTRQEEKYLSYVWHNGPLENDTSWSDLEAAFDMLLDRYSMRAGIILDELRRLWHTREPLFKMGDWVHVETTELDTNGTVITSLGTDICGERVYFVRMLDVLDREWLITETSMTKGWK